MLTMRPLPSAGSWRTKAWLITTGARRLVSMWRSQDARVSRVQAVKREVRRIVDQHAERAQRPGCRGHNTRRLVLAAQVRLDHRGPLAHGLDASGQRLGCIERAMTMDHHVETGPGDGLGHDGTQPLAAAGDQDSSCEFTHAQGPCPSRPIRARHGAGFSTGGTNISSRWLACQQARQGEAVLPGPFEPGYLRRFPLALVRKGAELVAFANLWATPDHGDLSIDLMRYRERRVHDVMDYLFIELLLWGKAQGFRRFDLGMAPLSGLQERQLAPLWTRAGAMLFTHADTFYNFEGLRRYKEKFRPVWEPRYLAAPGGLAAAAVLADVTTLVSGSALGQGRR